ncbi:MAG: RNA 2',3'-cyclic phosphodiesterase [Candidatus Nanohaloarchaea archaeon]|nr:RNA 2',3'-cyclic phosphodiesterase [Candidatus Nanohaloarchaea archaeon]
MGGRYFASLDVNDPNTREQLVEAQNVVTDYGSNSPTRPEQFHITLNFFGELGERDVKLVREQMEGLTQEPFELQLRGLGVFPDLDYISVVWAGTGRGRSQVKKLASALHGQLEDRFIQDQDFHPHVTLMRLKGIDHEEKERLQQLIQDNTDRVFGTIHVDSVLLKKSIREEGGARHVKVTEFDLQ